MRSYKRIAVKILFTCVFTGQDLWLWMVKSNN